jgi:hypothetical protein
MLRVIVILLAVAVVVFVARRIWLSVLQLRVGAVPEGVDVPDVPMEPDRGWQITRKLEGDVVTVNVEHPTEGVRRSWQIHLRDPGAVSRLDAAMRAAGRAVADLRHTD